MARHTTTLIKRTLESVKDITISYGKNKTAFYTGAVALSSSVIQLGFRYVPKVSRIFRRGKSAGRSKKQPNRQKGTMQQAAIESVEEESFQKDQPIKKKHWKRMKKNEEHGNDAFALTRNGSTLKKHDIEKKQKEFLTKGLVVQKQHIEACRRFNKSNHTLNALFDLDTYQTGLWVTLEGRLIKLNEKGIYSSTNNPYYIPDKMSESAGVTRLANDFGLEKGKEFLFISFVLAYKQKIFHQFLEDEEDTIIIEETEQKKAENNPFL